MTPEQRRQQKAARREARKVREAQKPTPRSPPSLRYPAPRYLREGDQILDGHHRADVALSLGLLPLVLAGKRRP